MQAKVMKVKKIESNEILAAKVFRNVTDDETME